MSYYVHLNIVWENNGNIDKVKDIAQKHLNIYTSDEYINNTDGISCASESILKSVSNEKSFFDGQKGGLWLSGGVFNYTSALTVIDELMSFFIELYENKLINRKGRIIIFEQNEQHDEVEIYQIYNEGYYNDPINLKINNFITNQWFFQED